jgi:hypothetical protein
MSEVLTTTIQLQQTSGKPPNPYSNGCTFTATSHTPPPPFGGPYSNSPEPDRAAIQETTQLEWCLSHSVPIGSITDSDSRCFTIERTLRTGLHCGAQVVLCRTTASFECVDSFPNPSFRLCIVDFNYSVVHRFHPDWNDPHPRLSPTARWWGSLGDFEEAEWLENADEWLWKTWEGTANTSQPRRIPRTLRVSQYGPWMMMETLSVSSPR